MNVILFIFTLIFSAPFFAAAQNFAVPSSKSQTAIIKSIVNEYFSLSSLDVPGATDLSTVFEKTTVVSSVSISDDGAMTLFIDRAFHPKHQVVRFREKVGRLPFALECRTLPNYTIRDFIKGVRKSGDAFITIEGDGLRIFEARDLREVSAVCNVPTVLTSLLEESMKI